jgi:UDP-glucose 4-epimerase
MRILITGGAGFIGSHIAESFQGKAEVVILDDFRSGDRKNLTGLNHQLIEGSILDEAKLHAAMQGVDQVFHLAAMISVMESVLKPQECETLNSQGTLKVLEAATQAKVKKVVLASSAAIYGNNPTVPKVESMTPEPQSPYASTKLDGEHLLERFRVEHGLATTSLRFFNVFGPRQNPQSAYAAAVPIFIAQAIKGEDINIFGDGEQTRDFIYVGDVVSALSFAAANPAMHGTYNVGYGQKISINDLARLIIKLTHSSSRIVYHPARLGDVKHSLASNAKLVHAGWKPLYTFDSGMAKTVDYFAKLKA